MRELQIMLITLTLVCVDANLVNGTDVVFAVNGLLLHPCLSITSFFPQRGLQARKHHEKRRQPQIRFQLPPAEDFP